jgi:hypothetical protein
MSRGVYTPRDAWPGERCHGIAPGFYSLAPAWRGIYRPPRRSLHFALALRAVSP